jgi:hypothetical protein
MALVFVSCIKRAGKHFLLVLNPCYYHIKTLKVIHAQYLSKLNPNASSIIFGLSICASFSCGIASSSSPLRKADFTASPMIVFTGTVSNFFRSSLFMVVVVKGFRHIWIAYG